MKILIASLLLLASSVAATPPETSFVPWFEQDGVKVEMARTREETPWIRASAEIAAPVAEVEAIVTDFEHYSEIFHPMFKKIEVLEHSKDRARVHAVWPFPWPLRDRDGVFEYTTSDSAGGATTLQWTNGARPGDPSAGVRISGIAGTLRLTPTAPNRCRVVYTYYGDLGGSFGESRNQKAWRGQPILYFAAIRRRSEKPPLRH